MSTAFYSRLCGLMLVAWLGLLPSGYAQRFAAIGDYGFAGTAERDVANLVKSWNPEFIITLGDNNYDKGDSTTIDQNIGQYYHEYIGNYKGRYGPSASTNRFFPSLGNHDYYTRNGEAYRYYFTLPGNGRYYDFVRGDVHFFALDSDPAEPDGVTVTSVQAQWLRAKLAASTARWKVVYLHHAPYSSGAHGNTPALQWPFKEWGASVVLAGHDHHYERLMQDGLPYFVNGLGGRSYYRVNAQPVPQSQFTFTGDYGAMLLNASPDSLTLQFFTRSRRLVDTYTLHRSVSASPVLYPLSPNPFQTATLVEYFLPSAARVQVRVLNILGQEVAILQPPTAAAAGWHRLNWERGALPAGLYFVQLLGDNLSQITRAELL
ncbi:metallophosphoesterase [Hymenobacter rigui]|uniref:T9SS C-terminal target domain-containing protein n=1 Tax=Hymenobacter rigui TaxID=334424 RepID=A0A3R9N6X6_9BACT|nr:metallophosphoesterase [Hymenobacter rigui]RSK49629.1 T9SS C-terminal target domain-containing protein [Hymenobacter rigui]